MNIIETKNKVKLIIEYLPKCLDFAQIYQEDLDKINIKVFLKDGSVVLTNEIKMITINKKDKKE